MPGQHIRRGSSRRFYLSTSTEPTSSSTQREKHSSGRRPQRLLLCSPQPKVFSLSPTFHTHCSRWPQVINHAERVPVSEGVQVYKDDPLVVWVLSLFQGFRVRFLLVFVLDQGEFFLMLLLGLLLLGGFCVRLWGGRGLFCSVPSPASGGRVRLVLGQGGFQD